MNHISGSELCSSFFTSRLPSFALDSTMPLSRPLRYKSSRMRSIIRPKGYTQISYNDPERPDIETVEDPSTGRWCDIELAAPKPTASPTGRQKRKPRTSVMDLEMDSPEAETRREKKIANRQINIFRIVCTVFAFIWIISQISIAVYPPPAKKTSDLGKELGAISFIWVVFNLYAELVLNGAGQAVTIIFMHATTWMHIIASFIWLFVMRDY
ncbi:hypothetical protein IWX91DRAFT_406034 [Phyllosticta citricarpa]